MTPKRYLVFGSVAIVIQGAVIASAPQSTLQLASASLDVNTAKNSHTNINLNLNRTEAIKASDTLAYAKTISTNERSPNEQAKAIETRESASTKIAAADRVASKATPTTVAASSVQATIEQPHKASDIPAQRDTHAHAKKKLNPDNSHAIDAIAQIAPKQSEAAPTPEQKHAADKRNAQVIDSNKPVMLSQTVELTQARFASPPPQPSYPRMARKKGLEGTATIEVMFNALGEQLALTLVQSSGFGLLDNAALEAVEHWQFEAPTPTLASHYRVRVPIRFALN